MPAQTFLLVQILPVIAQVDSSDDLLNNGRMACWNRRKTKEAELSGNRGCVAKFRGVSSLDRASVFPALSNLALPGIPRRDSSQPPLG